MSDEQKIQLLKIQAPLLFPLIEEYKIYNAELKDTLEPLSKLLKAAGELLRTNATKIMKTYIMLKFWVPDEKMVRDFSRIFFCFK